MSASPPGKALEKKLYNTYCDFNFDVETSTHVHISFTSLASKVSILLYYILLLYSDAVEIILKRRRNGANQEENNPYCDVMTIQQTRHCRFSRFWRRNISRWRHRWSKLTGGTLSSMFFLFLSMSELALAYVAITYVYHCTNSRTVEQCQSVRWLWYQIYQACCVRVVSVVADVLVGCTKPTLSGPLVMNFLV